MSVTARIVCADAIDFLHAQEDDSIDLLFTSPPYELARTYGIGERMVGGEAWVSWMVAVVKAASPKVKGLIAINCEGQTRNYRYSMTPFLLAADLHRAGYNLRKPVVFHRVGIPGSGVDRGYRVRLGSGSAATDSATPCGARRCRGA